jgi:DNA-binding CsgD family transcriptional regulator
MFVVSGFLDATAPRPSALVIEGEAGIGKTTIVNEALAHARSHGLNVFLCRPSAGERELPYVGLGDLFGDVGSEVLALLAGPQRAAIEVAFARTTAGIGINAYAVSRGVLELLRLEGARASCLVAIDDVQWLDRSSEAVLEFALRRLGQVPLLVMVAARTERGSSSALPLRLGEWNAVRRLEIGPLSITELGAVVSERLGAHLSRPRIESLWRDSGGNPMFAIELATGHTAPTLDSALGERLHSLDGRAKAALTYVAAALRPTVDLILRAGVERQQLSAALESGVIHLDDDRLLFAHPTLRSAALELQLPDERRRIHRSLAEVSTNAVERGHHLLGSATQRDDAVAQMLEEAADEAAGLGDHSGAAAFMLRAAELTTELSQGTAQGRELRAAVELDLAGDVEAASALARGLVLRLPAGTVRARARNVAVYSSAGSGLSLDAGLAELALALEDAEGDNALKAELHLAMAEFSSSMCLLDAAVEHARTAVTLADKAGVNSVAVDALSELGFAQCMLGGGVSDAARLAFARWDGKHVSANTYTPRMSLACELMYTTDFDSAEELLGLELTMAQERGYEAIEVMARGLLAEAQLRRGAWGRAFQNARLALEHARQAAIGQIVTGSYYPLAMIEALVGRHEQARALASTGLRAAESAGDFWFTIYHRAVLGLVELGEDDFQAAVDILEPAWRLMLDRRLGDLSIFPVAHVLSEALVGVGRLDEARQVGERLNASPVGDRPWCRAMSWRCEALVSSASGNHVAARAAAASALAAHAELDEPFEHARTLHTAGRVERRARNWGVARAAFVDALERYDSLGAAWWADKAARDIARLPGRRPADPHALTTREREIAELVATGLANKGIAAQLHVSVSTVEASLTRLYAKIGVHSRAELASRLSRGLRGWGDHHPFNSD